MQRSIALSAVALSMVLGCYFCSGAQEANQRGAGKTDRTWEYQVTVLSDVVTVEGELLNDTGKARAALESKFNDLGRAGWEFCGTIPGGVVFKRPRS